MTCEFCGGNTPDVQVQRDPFAWDVAGEDVRVPMCDSCMQDRVDDI